AREGLEGAISVVGPSDDVLARTAEIVPAIAGRVRKVPPGVEVGRFHPAVRREALEAVSELLAADPETSRGRPRSLDAQVEAGLLQRDGEALEALAHRYDQTVPDPEAAMRLQALASYEGPLVGYFGKLIVQKGVEKLLESLALIGPDVKGLVVGFGLFREWLEALVTALDRGDAGATAWLAGSSGMRLELDRQVASLAGLRDQVTFTGKLDHRYAPGALAALDVLVVPSTLPESFGMVVAEGAAAGALPLVARHSGLAEAAGALEAAVGRPGLFTFEPGDGATRRLTAGIERILGLPAEERAELRAAVSGFVALEWTWERTADRLLEAARRP
ncbi:MAG: glycosyltransferase, partial [Actinomycetota bacterium]